MFQVDASLKTFATTWVESFTESLSIDGERLPDHRLAYLTFEGKIPDKSGMQNRGSVRRVASGEFEINEDSPTRFSARLLFNLPTNLNCRIDIQRMDFNGPEGELFLDKRDRWRISLSPE